MKKDQKSKDSEASQAFDELVAQAKKLLDEQRDDDFKIATIQALQHLELSMHRNNLQALQLLVCCITVHYDGDDTAAQLLMFVSGALVEDSLCAATLRAIRSASCQVGQPGDPSRS